MQPPAERDDFVVARAVFLAAAVVTAAVAFRNFGKNVSIRCRDVAHQIGEREFVWTESPIDLTGWNSPDDIHRALMDFFEIPERLLRVTNFDIYPPFPKSAKSLNGHGGDQPLFAVPLPVKTAGARRSVRMQNHGRQDLGGRQSFGQSSCFPGRYSYPFTYQMNQFRWRQLSAI